MQGKSIERIQLYRKLLFTSLNWQQYAFPRLLGTSRFTGKNYYEILGVDRNCTTVEIREAFIQLSKKLHPDINTSGHDASQKLVNEAYAILSRPRKRAHYDSQLFNKEQMARMQGFQNYNGVYTNAPPEKVIFRDDSLWEHRDRSQDKKYEERPYYGVPGIKKRLPNHYVAAGAIIFMIVGSALYMYVAKLASNKASKHLQERDRMASMNHKIAKDAALANGMELQLALFRKKINNGKDF